MEVYEFTDPGYRPLVYSQDWMVALLNYEGIMGLERALEIERHKKTDEVFILLKGQAAFYLIAGDQPLQIVELKPGLIYNVRAGTWHNLLATPQAVFAIVENRDTDRFDTELRPLSYEERKRMHALVPEWAQ
jgi:mannose-6-phosphate isomerase-like protein (cupin superfamily)